MWPSLPPWRRGTARTARTRAHLETKGAFLAGAAKRRAKEQAKRGEGEAQVNAIDIIQGFPRFLPVREASRPLAPRSSKEPRKNAGDGGPGSGTALITRTKTQTRRPNMYRVLLLNDDYTTQEFVVLVLRKYFNKSIEDATRIMLHVHNHGVGECGIYTYEVAETKVTQVMDYARKHQHPLQCIMEKK